MAKYLYRTCAKCKGYLGVVIPKPLTDEMELPVDGYCADCGYRPSITHVVVGRQFSSGAALPILPKVVYTKPRLQVTRRD